MNQDEERFRIRSNHVPPEAGRVLIAEPFMQDAIFGRSVILLIDHTEHDTMGLILNKRMPYLLNEVIKDLRYVEDIPLYRGGPLGIDTVFYLHTLADLPGAYPMGKGLFLNGNFEVLKNYILEGNVVEGNIRFFLGHAGWGPYQLQDEIDADQWLVGDSDRSFLMSQDIDNMWRKAMEGLGEKYKAWAHFPQSPTLN